MTQGGETELVAAVQVELVAALQRADAARREAERANTAAALSGVGVWEFDLVADTSRRSPRHDQIFGYDVPISEADWTLHRFIDHVHPEDRASVEDQFRRALTDAQWEFECRIRRSDGAERWIWVHAASLDHDDGGRPTRLLGIVMDVTERKALETALRESDRHKDEFLAMLAHELRNPLGSILHASEILARFATADPTAERASRILGRQVSHLTRLVDDLLDVARMTRGKAALRTARLDLAALISSIAEDARSDFEAREVALEVKRSPDPVWVEADRARIIQAIANLVSNAAKFTKAGGRVRLELSRTSEVAIVTVTDNGVGMDASTLERVFTNFAQDQQDLARTSGGLGLGAGIARGIVEMHGGTATATSRGRGHGSRFTIHLPLAGPPEDAEAESSPPTRDLTRRHILIIEDSPDMREVLEILLTEAGHQVSLAASGQAGIKIARNMAPDIVLCDIGLAGDMDGYAVARELREMDGDLRLVALTGYGQAADQQRARDAGFDLHLTKPVSLAAIEELVDNLPQRSAVS